MRQKVRWGSGVLLVLILGLFVYAKVFTPMSEDRAQALLEKGFAPALLNGVAPVGYPIESGTPIAIIEIDDINLRRVVVEGTKAEDLSKGPGHLVGSALPGQPGTSAILGRSSRYGSAFARLDELKVGQEVTVTTAQGVHTFLQRLGAPRLAESNPCTKKHKCDNARCQCAKFPDVERSGRQ